MGERKILYNVVYMRVALTILVICSHAFAPFTGVASWPIPYGVNTTEVQPEFWIIATCFSCFMLEAFVFMSGYLVGVKKVNSGLDALSFNYLIKKKISRLIVPSLIFSIFYVLLFYDDYNWNSVITILSGAGHLWFLPMLFWCFCLLWVVLKFNINPILVIVVSIIASLFSYRVAGIPFQTGRAVYYFIYFYLGYLIKSRNKEIHNQLSSMFILSFVLSFAILCKYALHNGYCLPGGGILRFILSTNIIAGLSGSLLLYLICNIFRNVKCNEHVEKLSNLCFGVYILQQFILMALYYNTPIPHIVTVHLLPWGMIITTIIITIPTVNILMNNKYGKILLGS